jgi:predicted RNase H-like nuclease (RuvC/YqgF family)
LPRVDPLLHDLSTFKDPAPEKSVELPPQRPEENGVAVQDELPGLKDALVQKLEQKCSKLEQILEEKNRIVAKLEESFRHEQNNRQETDGVKQIFQQEIEQLKGQNKQIKNEMAKILEENLALQSKVTTLEKVLGGQKNAPFVEQGGPATELRPGSSLPLSAGPDSKGAGRPAEEGLTLRDVFGDETKT